MEKKAYLSTIFRIQREYYNYIEQQNIMNKNSIIGFVLLFAIFVGYMWWIAPSK